MWVSRSWSISRAHHLLLIPSRSNLLYNILLRRFLLPLYLTMVCFEPPIAGLSLHQFRCYRFCQLFGRLFDLHSLWYLRLWLLLYSALQLRFLRGTRAIQTEVIKVQVEMVEVRRHWWHEGLIILFVRLLYDHWKQLLFLLILAVLGVFRLRLVNIGRRRSFGWVSDIDRSRVRGWRLHLEND